MSAGMTIADLVQQVLYAVYKVRLDVRQGEEGSFHSNTDKFKEIVMEANFVLQELQKDQDWNFLRDRMELGIAHNPPHGGIQEFSFLSDDIYKICTGYNDAVRLHYRPHGQLDIPITSARSGNTHVTSMFNEWGEANAPDHRIMAFQVGDTLTFTRPWFPFEEGGLVETDVIRRFEPLHICDHTCPRNCPKAYEERVLKDIPDPLYVVYRTAAKRAEGDPSAVDRVQPLTDDAQKILSAMRENDSAKTWVDSYTTAELGYVGVL